MEVPRAIAVYGGRMLAVIFFSPWRGSICMCVHGTGRAAEQGTATCCVCALAEGRMILPMLVNPQSVAGVR